MHDSSANDPETTDFERMLLERVRPGGWRNPEPRDGYDLVVLGAGTGGLVSAAIAAGLGASVALVERDRMGGDCLNRGCVPSKGLLRASRSWAQARASEERFGGPSVTEGGDFAAAARRMRRIRAELSAVDAADRFRSLGVDVFLGEGQFDSARSLVVDDARLRFRRAIVATGARAAMPPIPGLEGIGALTNHTVFDLDQSPERLLVLGAGAIGCELAQAFARFGSDVTLLDMADRVLPGEEPDASAALLRTLERDGVRFMASTRVEEARTGEGGSKRLMVQGPGGRAELEGDQILVALGRTPNVDAGLEQAGVAYGSEGIEVDERLRTTNRRVYAVGDVASRFQFTHAADAQARLAVRNALFFGRGKSGDLVIPWATYTSPEVARVGTSAAEAADLGLEIDTVTVSFGDVDRARLDGDDDGFLRVHMRAGRDRIVGATVVHPHAGELISQITQAMTRGTGLEALSDVVFPYPTAAEALRKAADARKRAKLTPRVSWAFEQYFRIWRRLT